VFTNNYDPLLAKGQGELPVKPTGWQSARESAALAGHTAVLGLGAIGLVDHDIRENAKLSIDAISESLSDERFSFGQKAGNYISNMAVYGLISAPLFISAEAGASALIGKSAIALSPALPSAVVNFARSPLSKIASGKLADWIPSITVGKAAKSVAGFSAGMKASIFPEKLAETYDIATDSYNWKKAADLTLNDNLGIGIGITLGAFGLIVGRAIRNSKVNLAAESTSKSLRQEVELNRAQKDTEIKGAISKVKEIKAYEKYETESKEAVESAHKSGQLSDEDLEYYKLHVEHPENPDLYSMAIKILEREQQPFDRISGKIWTKLIHSEDIKTLKSSIGDELSSGESNYPRAVSQYTLRERLDSNREEMIDNPSVKDGLDAYVHYANKKLNGKEAKLQELDSILDKHLHKGLKKKSVISQRNIYNHLKHKGKYNSEESPFIVPENVSYKLKLRKKLEDLQSGKSNRYKKWFKDDAILKIKEDIRSIPFETPAQELNSLREKILRRLDNNYRNSAPYQRLLDLSEVHPQAEILLRRIEDEALMIKHEAMAALVSRFTDFVDSQVGKLAKPENVLNYMKERYERLTGDAKTIQPIKSEVVEIKEKIKNTVKELKNKKTDDAILNDQTRRVKKSDSEKLDQDFHSEKNKYEQFRDNESVFENLINCSKGFISG